MRLWVAPLVLIVVLGLAVMSCSTAVEEFGEVNQMTDTDDDGSDVSDEPDGDSETGDTIETDDEFESVTANGMTFEWRVTSNQTILEIRLTGPTTGWIACGFASSVVQTMQHADIYIGTIDGETVSVRDDHSISSFPYHAADSQNDVTVDSAASSESDGSTTIAFQIPLNSGDSDDLVLVPGQSYSLLLAYGQSDSLTQQHAGSARARTTITL